jgi:hypothetical protein
LVGRVQAGVLCIPGSPFDATCATELPTGNLKTDELGKVIYGVEIVDSLLSKISDYRESMNCLQEPEYKI